MLIYLDTCSIQRPLDDRSQPRINIEAEAVVTILNFIESGEKQLLSSEVLEFEIRKTPDLIRRTRSAEILSVADKVAQVSITTRTRAQEIVAAGIKPVDALHVAVSMENHVTYFCTCDDKLLKKLQTLRFDKQPCFVSPLELVVELTSK